MQIPLFFNTRSSLSVVLNSTAGVLLEDICRGCLKRNPSEKAANFIVKSSIIILGILSMVFLCVVEKLGGILEVATSLSSIAAGTTFGIFTLGMLIPWSNNAGAIAGGVAGALITGWISFGSQAAAAAGLIVPDRLNMSIEGCATLYTNVTHILTTPTVIDESETFPLYRLSFLWINPIGILTVLIVGTIVSFMSGAQDLREIDPKLISPIIHRFLPDECFHNNRDSTIEYTGELFTLNIDESNQTTGRVGIKETSRNL